MSEPRKATSQATTSEATLRRAVVETAIAMSREGLSPGRSGNVSARIKGGMLVTPTGLPYETLSEDDIVFVDRNGKTRPGALKPSSEWLFHMAIYKAKPAIGAVVHCHSLHATALACARRSIPAFHYMVAVAGGEDIPLAPYATFGTKALADAVAETLRERNACLMEHHGQIACGKDLTSALDLAREVENLANQYVLTLQIGGKSVLHSDEMALILEKFRGYGQQ